jgi:hypothetical protein
MMIFFLRLTEDYAKYAKYMVKVKTVAGLTTNYHHHRLQVEVGEQEQEQEQQQHPNHPIHLLPRK